MSYASVPPWVLLLIDDDEGAERPVGELFERIGGHADAAVADGTAEDRRVGPAVEGDGAGTAAVGVEGVAVGAERQDHRREALGVVDDRAEQEGAAGRGRRGRCD